MTVNEISRWYDFLDSFWEVNPQFKNTGLFKEFHKKDNSKGKVVSSRVMWAIAQRHYPESDIYWLEDTEKLELINKDVLGKPDFDWSTLTELIEFFEKVCVLKEYRHLIVLYKKLEERKKLYEDTPTTLANVKALDDMLKSEPIIIAAINSAKLEVKSATSQGRVLGGGELSLSEKGVI